MPSGGVQRLAILRIKPQIGCGDELIAQLLGESSFHSAQYCSRIIRAGHHRLHRHLDHRGNQGGRNAVSGDIGDEEASPVWVDSDKPVEISSDSGHRIISGADAQMAEFHRALQAALDGFLLRHRIMPDDYQAARDRKSTRLNSSHWHVSRMPSSA